PAYRTTARISIPAPVPMPAWTDLEVVRLLSISSPPASPLSLWSSPPPQILFPSLPLILSPPSPIFAPAPPPSPIRSLGYRAAMIRLRDEAASTSHSPPSQLPSASRREDRPEVTLPPRKRLDIALGPRYEVGESSSAAAARPAGACPEPNIPLRANLGVLHHLPHQKSFPAPPSSSGEFFGELRPPPQLSHHTIPATIHHLYHHYHHLHHGLITRRLLPPRQRHHQHHRTTAATMSPPPPRYTHHAPPPQQHHQGTERVRLGFGSAPLGYIGFMAAATLEQKGHYPPSISSLSSPPPRTHHSSPAATTSTPSPTSWHHSSHHVTTSSMLHPTHSTTIATPPRGVFRMKQQECAWFNITAKVVFGLAVNRVRACLDISSVFGCVWFQTQLGCVSTERVRLGFRSAPLGCVGFMTAATLDQKGEENKKADALSKIASTCFAHLSKQVIVEELMEKAIDEKEILWVVEEEGHTWMTLVYEYLTEGILPEEKKKARTANYVLREIREGLCSMHAGPRSMVAKALRSCYFWPTMHTDARNLIRECKDYLVHRPVPRNPQEKLTPITSPWPFYKWGIDIAGPFLEGPGRVKFLIVAIDYFTKWIEARPVATITGTQVKKFVWDNIVCRFGLLGEIVSNNGNQFRDNPFKDWCEKLSIHQCFASVKHPQANGLVERANRSLREGIKARLGEKIIPAKIGMPTLRTAEVDMVKNNEALGINLDLLEEKREQAAIQEARNKAKVEGYYNARVRSTSFRLGDFVYRSNEASHAEDGGKLGPKWEGPYEVT
nr:reverse transcriptase domain-containing protein [Tanacetum cinerariifolium]